MSSGITKFSGTGFTADNLNIACQAGVVTKYAPDILQTPIRSRLNSVVDCLDGMLAGTKGFDQLTHKYYSSMVDSKYIDSYQGVGQAICVGAIVIETKLKFSTAEMFNVRLQGSQYRLGQPILDIQMSGYAYVSNTVIGGGFINRGSIKSKIRWGTKTVGADIYLVLVVGETTDNWNYMGIHTDGMMLYGPEANNHLDWDIIVTTDLSGYGSLTEFPDCALFQTKGETVNVNNDANTIGTSLTMYGLAATGASQDLTIQPTGIGRVNLLSQYCEFGDGHISCLQALGGPLGSSSLFLYNGTTLSALFRHTPSSNVAQIINYIGGHYNGMAMYDVGQLDLMSTNDYDLNLISCSSGATGSIVLKTGNDILLKNGVGTTLSTIDGASGAFNHAYAMNVTGLLNVTSNINTATNYSIDSYTVIDSVRKGIFTALDVDAFNFDSNSMTMDVNNNLACHINGSGYVHQFGNLIETGRSAVTFYSPPVATGTWAAIYGSQTNSIGTAHDLRIGTLSANYGIYYDRSVNRVGINKDAPAEALDVTGHIRSSSGYKVGTTEVIDSSGGFTGPLKPRGFTDFANAEAGEIAKDSNTNHVYLIIDPTATPVTKKQMTA